MKATKKIILSLLILTTASGVFCARNEEVPPLGLRVNDTANMFSRSCRTDVERILEEHEKKTTNQIAVLTIPKLGGEALEQYSIRVAEKWKLGLKGKDNGVLLLFVRDDRKVRIEVGYGLEGSLSDLRSGRIIREIIVPHFKKKQFDEGLKAAVQAVISVISGEFKDGDEKKFAPKPSLWERFLDKVILWIGLLFAGLIGLGILYVLFNACFFTNTKGGWPAFFILGAAFYVPACLAFQPLAKNLAEQGLPPFLAYIPPILIVLGIKFLFAFTEWGKGFAKKHKIDWNSAGSSGESTDSSSSSGSSWSSSSSDSSGSSSFSGGGGSFGGGGSSGSW